jgi:hypothetical protein
MIDVFKLKRLIIAAYEEGSMFVSRLLILLLLVPACALEAQSSQGSQNKSVEPSSPPTSPPPSGNVTVPTNRINVPPFDPSAFVPKINVTMRMEGTCYSMRDYVFTQDDPKSDATRLTGQSTCTPMARLVLRGTALPNK